LAMCTNNMLPQSRLEEEVVVPRVTAETEAYFATTRLKNRVARRYKSLERATAESLRNVPEIGEVVR
jgi:hypothetical protein